MISRIPDPAKCDRMEVTGRDELAAAIQALPIDAPAEIILRRANGKPMTLRFDLRNATPRSLGVAATRRRLSGSMGDYDFRSEHLRRIAARVRKSPKELWA